MYSKKSNKLSDSSSTNESENASSDDERVKKKRKQGGKKLGNKNAGSRGSGSTAKNKKVKYSSDDDNNDDDENETNLSEESEDSEAESQQGKKEDSDYNEDDDSDESEEKSEDSSSTDIDDSDDSDYNFGKRKKSSKKRKKAAAKKATRLSRSGSSRNKRTVSSRGRTTSKSLKSSADANQSKVSYDKRTTVKKVVNYCEDDSDESEEVDDEEEDDDLDSDDSERSARRSKAKNKSKQKAPPPATHDLNVETLEKVLKVREGRVGATGSKTAIYNVEELGDPNKDETLSSAQFEKQYLIKWMGWSHLHNTWESRESLLNQKVNGMKKLENFLKKEEELRISKLDAKMSPEDIEYMECQKEMMENLLETHQLLERIIAANVDYLCKWQGLPYSECTWEDGELIKRRFPEQVDDYNRRQAATTLAPANIKSQKALRIRPRFVALKEQPAYLGASDPDFKLRDYQLDGLNWLANSWCKQNGVILADEMGLGKTIQTISFISYTFNEHNLYGPFLVVIPLSTIQGWQREFQKWSPEINVVLYLGDSSSRSMIQQHELYAENRKVKANVVLTTYEILLKDKSFFNSMAWVALIVDEAHRLKNEDSLLYRTLVKFDTNHRMLITGTPLQNSLRELWALLNFIMPEKFDNWEEFDAKYSLVLSDGLRFQDLHKELQPYLLRRVKKDVEKSLPAKVEQILRVEMTTIQKQYYKLILTKNYKELAKGAKGNVNTFLNLMMELKKCSNHTYLIRRDEGAGDNVEQLIKGSGKLLLLDKLLRRLKETGHRVLIFSQMVRMLDIIAEYLRFRRFPFQRLDGSIKGEIRRQALDHFNKEDSDDFCFLLSTRAGGLGINLATADTVIIYDSDWNPQNDLQAQARAHRIGQKNQVNIYRLVSKNSIEEDIVERAKQKMVLDHLVIQRMDTTGRTVLNKSSIAAGSSSIPFNKDEINSILKFGAEELFKEKEAATNNNNEEEKEEKEETQLYDIDEILKRAETREETNYLSATEELLSQFKVANFSTMEDEPIDSANNPTSSGGLGANHAAFEEKRKQLEDKSWLDIIPEADRKRIELEEEEEKLRQMHLTALESRRRTNNNNQSKTGKQPGSEDEDNYHSGDGSVNSSDSEHHQHKKSKGKGGKSRQKDEHVVKGLNAQEVRRFVRSYRKFPAPLNLIDTIAQDANLEEKSQAILIEFAKKMQQLCRTSITKYESMRDPADLENDKKKRERGPELDINGVKVLAYQILETQTYFEPLTYYYTQLADKNAETQFQFKTKLKQTYWDCEWTEEEDKSLLRAIYEYGYGNWEWIKADPELKLGDKILVSDQTVVKTTPKEAGGNAQDTTAAGTSKRTGSSKTTSVGGSKLKPQSKHLRTRIDYLIKVLQNQMNTEKYGANWKGVLNLNENSNSKSTQSTVAGSSSSRKRNDESGANVGSNENSITFQSEEKSRGKKAAADNGQANNSSTLNLNKSKRKLKQPSSSGDKLLLANDSNDSENSENNANESKVII